MKFRWFDLILVLLMLALLVFVVHRAYTVRQQLARLEVVSPDGRCRAVLEDDRRTIRVWDTATGEEIFSVKEVPEVLGMHFVQDPRGEGIIYALKNSSGPFIHILRPNPGLHRDDPGPRS